MIQAARRSLRRAVFMLPEMCRSRADTLDREAWERAYKEKAYDDSRADAAWEQAYREKAYADDRADSERDWSYRLGEIGQKVYAYGDGAPYEIGSGRGLSFLSAAAPGQIMTGGDGSVWVKNADGSTVITRGGETWTVPAPASAGSRGSGGSGRSASSAKPDLTAAQVLSALNAGVRSRKVLDAYEYWYGEPYADPGGADTERETAADPSMLPRFSLPGLSDRFGGSLDAGPQNTGLTTAAYNMAGRGIIELWDKGDDANRQKARDQLAAVWPSLSEEQKRNMRSVLGLHGMEISA